MVAMVVMRGDGKASPFIFIPVMLVFSAVFFMTRAEKKRAKEIKSEGI